MKLTKSLFQSKTIWGSAIAIVAGLVSTFTGYSVDDTLQQQLLGHIDSLIAVVGGLLAWYGRVKATKAIA